MAAKIRILAHSASQGSKPVYEAEAYEAEDRFRERKWSCTHEHESMEHALICGMAWLDEQPNGGSRTGLTPL